MKRYTINVHFDMVVTEEVEAENIDEARQTAERLAAEKDLNKADCMNVDSCLVDEKLI